MDALVVLSAERQKEGLKAEAFDKLTELDREINAIKTQAAASRLDRVIADLTTLKEKEPKEYDRVAAALRDVLKGEQ